MYNYDGLLNKIAMKKYYDIINNVNGQHGSIQSIVSALTLLAVTIACKFTLNLCFVLYIAL